MKSPSHSGLLWPYFCVGLVFLSSALTALYVVPVSPPAIPARMLAHLCPGHIENSACNIMWASAISAGERVKDEEGQ